MLLACPWSATSARGDQVEVRSSESGAPFVVEGEVVEWNREQIVIERPTGQRARYAATRVLRVDTTWPDDYDAALVHMNQGEYRQAADRFLAAARALQRPWARREAMAHLARCYASAGAWSRAVETWLATVAGDPAARALDEVPLAWFAMPAIDRDTLAKWWRTTSDDAQLIAASWMIATADREAAIAKLNELARRDDQRVARLARAQLWRSQLVQADIETVDRWHREARQWADSVGGGPWLVVAEGYARLGEHQQAMLAAMRPVVLAPAGSPLRPQGLLQAARSAQQLGEADNARRLAAEIVRQHAESPQRVEAQALLNSKDQ
jgi:TolA-binding protein